MNNEYEYEFPIGAIVYVKTKAQKGELQKVCIKNVNLIGHPTKNYTFNYQDTTNRVWLEEELIWGCDAEILINKNIINYEKTNKQILKLEDKIEEHKKNLNNKKRRQLNTNTVTIGDCHDLDINNEIPEYLGDNVFKTKYPYNNETLKVYLNGQRLGTEEFDITDSSSFTMLTDIESEDQIIIDYKKILII